MADGDEEAGAESWSEFPDVYTLCRHGVLSDPDSRFVWDTAQISSELKTTGRPNHCPHQLWHKDTSL